MIIIHREHSSCVQLLLWSVWFMNDWIKPLPFYSSNQMYVIKFVWAWFKKVASVICRAGVKSKSVIWFDSKRMCVCVFKHPCEIVTHKHTCLYILISDSTFTFCGLVEVLSKRIKWMKRNEAALTCILVCNFFWPRVVRKACAALPMQTQYL